MQRATHHIIHNAIQLFCFVSLIFIWCSFHLLPHTYFLVDTQLRVNIVIPNGLFVHLNSSRVLRKLFEYEVVMLSVQYLFR